MRIFSLLPVATLVAACEGEPRFVYVPSAEPEVELLVSASATEVAVGEAVILRAERTSRGEWKQVRKSSLAPDQCWRGRPPPDREAEVSDNVRWEAFPSQRARFNTIYREDRTREVVFLEAGTFTLESSTEVWCRASIAKGKPIRIVVRARPDSGPAKP